MTNYNHLLELTIELARTKQVEETTKMDLHCCGDPSCIESEASLKRLLALYKNNWEYAVTYSFRGPLDGMREILIKETQLRVEIIAYERDEKLHLAVIAYPLFAPLLASLFYNPPSPPPLRVLRSVNTETSWAQSPLSVYWVTSSNHAYDWFVVAHNESEAVNFFASMTSSALPDAKAEKVGSTSLAITERIHNSRVGWASPDSIWSAGGHITKFKFPRIAKFGETTYQEGSIPLSNEPPTQDPTPQHKEETKLRDMLARWHQETSSKIIN